MTTSEIVVLAVGIPSLLGLWWLIIELLTDGFDQDDHA